MITITQNKIAGLDPRWAPFAGFSVLFDNGAGLLTVEKGISKIACAPALNGPLNFYSRIEKTLAKLDLDILTQTYLFCPLPTSSYHVTVWDGINVRNIDFIKPQVLSAWNAFLVTLPSSLLTPQAPMDLIMDSDLISWSGSISFEFEKLAIWKNEALVACLQPANSASAKVLEDISFRRTMLSESANREFGLRISKGYSPHISLGYFVNREYGQLARGMTEQWTELFRIGLQDSTITYSSLDVYGFTDMASFFKSTP